MAVDENNTTITIIGNGSDEEWEGVEQGINLEGSPSLITNGTASDDNANGDSISSTATSPTIIIQYIETTANPSSQPSAQPSLASSIIPSAHPNSILP